MAARLSFFVVVKVGLSSENDGMPSNDNAGSAVEQRIGTHDGSFDGELVCVTVNGEVTESDAAQMMDFIIRCDLSAGNLGMLVRAPGAFSVSPAARRYLAKSSTGDRPPIPMAVMGTSMLVRGILMLLLNAIRITLRIDVPVRFCETEAEAVAWLKAQVVLRAQVLAKKSAG